MTYTTDSRFEALHKPGSEEWTLRIMSAQPRDQGKYECQVNTDPKLNFAVLLTVKGRNLHSALHSSHCTVYVSFCDVSTKRGNNCIVMMNNGNKRHESSLEFSSLYFSHCHWGANFVKA